MKSTMKKDIEKLELRTREKARAKYKEEYQKTRETRLAKAKIKYAEKKKAKNKK